MSVNTRSRLKNTAAVLCAGAALTLGATLGCDQAAAQDKPAPAAKAEAKPEPFTGTFHATVNGERATLTIKRDGDTVSGKMDDVAFAGTVDGDAASGSVVEANTGAVVAYELTPKGDGLELKLTVTNPKTGQSATVPAIHFARRPAERAATQAAGDGQRDPRMVGRWRHTYARGGGGFSVAVDDWLILNEDGTVSTDSAMAGGTEDASFSGRRTGAKPAGRWKTENKVLYIAPEGGEFRPLAKYAVDRENMLLTYGNGNKTIYDRQ
jgi:hypothetical protein